MGHQSPEEAANAKSMDKITKLLALATRREGNEVEADAAMAMVQKLMARHNLDMATIEANGKSGPIGGTRAKDKSKGRAMYEFQRELMRYVAHANYCNHSIYQEWYKTPTKWTHEAKRNSEYSWEEGPNGERYYTGGAWRTRPNHVIIGRESNVASAKVMFDYLCVTIERIVPIENNNQRLSRKAMSWKAGCADRLCTRLYQRRADIEQAQKTEVAGAVNAIVLADYGSAERDFNYDFQCGYEPGTTAMNRAKREAEWNAGADERRANLIAEKDAAAKFLAGLTDKERKAHERREAKEAEKQARSDERWRQRARNERRRKDDSKDWDAYRAGNDAGRNIGLDAQVGSVSKSALRLA